MEKITKTLWVAFVFLGVTVAAAYIVGSIFSGATGNVALIRIKGSISPSSSLFSETASSDNIVDYIKDAAQHPNVKALLIEINSPGGAVVATKEIVTALKSVEKPTVCWLRDTAASGAYWIASACDVIVADEFTITGSIGVTGSYLEFSGLFEKYGINYVRLVSGEDKDAGTAFREPTKAELDSIKQIIHEMHNAFVEDVAINRGLSVEQVSLISGGSMFTGQYAKELGLVDVLGGKDDALEIIREKTNISEIELLEYKRELGISELVSGFMSVRLADMLAAGNLEIKAAR